MRSVTIAIGADHRGFAYKELIIALPTIGDTVISWIDVGTDSAERTDYPIYAQAAIQTLLDGTATHALLICGTGVGMSIAANRFPTIFAGICWNSAVARRARAEDGINTLILPADYISYEESILAIGTWISTEPLPGRYAERRGMIDGYTIG